MYEKNIGFRINLGKSLADKNRIYIDLYGNSEASTGTLKGAKALAKFLRESANKVDEWSSQLE